VHQQYIYFIFDKIEDSMKYGRVFRHTIKLMLI
jgi:hypothetical protein